MTVFRFRVTDENPAHVRADLFCGPDPDHLALSGRLTFRVEEWPSFADAITSWNERQEGGEERTEWGVQWHGADVMCNAEDGTFYDEASAREVADKYTNAVAVWRRSGRPAGPWTRANQEAEVAE